MADALIIARVIGDLQRSFRSAAMERQIDLSAGIDPAVPMSISTDAERVVHFLTSLVWNAIEDGHDHISIAVDVVPDNRVSFSIECTGIQLAELQRLSLCRELAAPLGELDVSRSHQGIVRLLIGEASKPHVTQQRFRSLLIIQRNHLMGARFTEAARECGARAVLTSRAEKGLSLARLLRPKAIIVDTSMTDIDGWVLLDLLKRDPDTCHIPVLALCTAEEGRRALRYGAFHHVPPPRSKDDVIETISAALSYSLSSRRRVLVIDGPLEWPGLDIEIAANGTDALASIEIDPPDCVIMPLILTDMNAGDLIDRLRSMIDRRIPVIVHAGKISTEIDADVVIEAGSLSRAMLTLSIARSLHLPESVLTQEQIELVDLVRWHDPILDGTRVLVVDDDVVTVFELTGLLERHRIEVSHCESGMDALAMLGSRQVDLVLMDILMPEMDGLQTIRHIRSNPALADIPIVAVTGRTVPGDREACLAGGATDYVPKPIDADRLVAHMRRCLTRV